MKKLFLLLALVGMVATACEDDGVNEPTTPEDKTQPIKFIDNRVKALCVDSWDTNGDAELSYEEAAAVTDIGTTFERSAIISFTELAYFTGLSYIANEAFLNCGSLKKIELPHNITSIGEWAFGGCNSLTSVAIPDSVTSIGTSAFAGCSSLTSVTIPDSVTEIGYSAFQECSSLKSFYGKFASEDNRCLIVDGKLIAFAPVGLTEYIIPDSVTSIGDYAFAGCSSLTSVTIPNSVNTIGDSAFWGCSSLTSVYCKPTTPPAGGFFMFDWNASDRKIYVPTASIEAYKSAEYWSDYASDIVGYEF